MLVLNATTDSIDVVLGGAVTTDQMKIVSSWRDITTTAYTAGRTTTSTNNTTAVSVVTSPAASTQRVIDLVNIYNADTVAQAITVRFNDNGTNYELTKITLGTLQTLQFAEGKGWSVLDALGQSLSATQVNAAGTDTMIQFNDGGTAIAGDADFTWDKTNNTLILGGTDTDIRLKGITAEPAAPDSGNVILYTKAVVGKMQLKIKGPSGLDTPLQAALWQNNFLFFSPGAAAGVWNGTVGANLGTAAIALPTTTNLYTVMRRSTFASVVTTANQQVGTRTEAMFFRGNATGLGGFLFVCRFGFNVWKTGNRLFVGLSVATTAQVTVNPSTLLNQIGFGVDTADTAITFMHNDGAGTCTKDAIAGQPSLANNNGYDAYIWCAPNDTTVYYRLDDVLTGATIIDTSTSTDLPVNTTALLAHCAMSNASNVLVNDATLGINRIYIETDR